MFSAPLAFVRGFGMFRNNIDGHFDLSVVPEAVLQQVTVILRFVPYSSSDGTGLLLMARTSSHVAIRY